jgi:hypothetical protein
MKRSITESAVIAIAAGIAGIVLAYVVGCAAEGAWLTPGTDMLRPLVNHPQFVMRTTGILVAVTLLAMALRRTRKAH